MCHRERIYNSHTHPHTEKVSEKAMTPLAAPTPVTTSGAVMCSHQFLNILSLYGVSTKALICLFFQKNSKIKYFTSQNSVSYIGTVIG